MGAISNPCGGGGADGRGARERDRVVKLSIADGTALRCGRVGSRHFRRAEDSSLGFFVFIQSVNVLHKKRP